MPRRPGRGAEAPAAARVQTKRVGQPAAPGDGARVLVMRLWPRGIRRTSVDHWLKGLGTPRELIRQWKSQRITWAEVVRAYRDHLRSAEAQADLHTLLELARQGPVTLLCTCPDEARCHRGILKQVLGRALRQPA